jgi:SAM-dependent MidA family methyltransferase
MASPLERALVAGIEAQGPISIAEYMARCVAHYYATRDPLGARGDFITAPEVSQMFGELIGVWMAAVWQQIGSPSQVRIVELGPGRGTLMADALRAAKALPDFLDAVSVHLVEMSPVLRDKQRETLRGVRVPLAWHTALDEVPSGPAIVVANEFFDALPVHQAVKRADGWHERRIGINASGRLSFTEAAEPIPGFGEGLPLSILNTGAGSIFEWCDPGPARALGGRIAQGGAALVIDYGHVQSAVGDTLQAVGAHAFADPLDSPGERDLTAHVDFEALIRDGSAAGATAFGPLQQGEFLRRLGIETRAAKLKASATAQQTAAIDASVARLAGSGPNEMGRLFKVAGFAQPSLQLPGFDVLGA